jgi:hypothetical protein
MRSRFAFALAILILAVPAVGQELSPKLGSKLTGQLTDNPTPSTETIQDNAVGGVNGDAGGRIDLQVAIPTVEQITQDDIAGRRGAEANRTSKHAPSWIRQSATLPIQSDGLASQFVLQSRPVAGPTASRWGGVIGRPLPATLSQIEDDPFALQERVLESDQMAAFGSERSTGLSGAADPSLPGSQTRSQEGMRPLSAWSQKSSFSATLQRNEAAGEFPTLAQGSFNANRNFAALSPSPASGWRRLETSTSTNAATFTNKQESFESLGQHFEFIQSLGERGDGPSFAPEFEISAMKSISHVREIARERDGIAARRKQAKLEEEAERRERIFGISRDTHKAKHGDLKTSKLGSHSRSRKKRSTGSRYLKDQQ